MPPHRSSQHAGVREYHIARRDQQTGRERSRDRLRRDPRERMDSHQCEAVRRHREGTAETIDRTGEAELTRAAREERPSPAENAISAAISHRGIRHDVAAVAGLSPSHFKSLFRASVGLPVHQYLIRRRVERAKSLLGEGRMPISQIAFETGFAHQSHLARHMRRVLGLSPKALRETLR